MGILAIGGGIASTIAQTILSGDHVIDGDLAVGTNSNGSKMVITGESGNNASPGIKVMGDGGVLFQGNYGSGQIPTEEDGARFMWYPRKAALSAGITVNGSGSDEFIGNYSFGMGVGTIAGGDGSMAVGDGTFADGRCSVAIGYGAGANGDFSIALGEVPTADGHASLAVGISATTEGTASVAMGECTWATSYASAVIGRWNVREGSSGSWIETDPLFVIGNGTGNWEDPPDLLFHNAFVVYKNGNVEVTGKVSMPRQGDILMGEFGNPE